MYAPALLPPGPTTDEAAGDPLALLSDCEREVTALLVEGLSYTQIADELFGTRSAIAHHLRTPTRRPAPRPAPS